MRDHLTQAEKLQYNYQKKAWFLDAVEIYCDAITGFAGDLSNVALKSRGFLGFREYVASYVGSAHFASLLAETKKLKAELRRMSHIVDDVTPNSMLLFNESFAATNEREGSEIARQITSALVEKGIKVFFVTHLYEFAHGLHARKMKNAIFLRAERMTDGARTFRLVEGAPLQTSYGEDLYEKVFNA